jgi:hypothetical protein
MAGQHKGNTTEFGALSFVEQAKSITEAINSLQVAIEHHVEHSPRRLETIETCLAQVDRLRVRLRDAYEQQSAHPDSSRSVLGVEEVSRLRVGSPRLAEPERAADFVMEVAEVSQMPAYDGRYAPAAPVARVSLRNPGSGTGVSDLPMLIDSGSDVTLLLDSAVASLGLRGTGERYRLEAFDGTITESEAVHAVLVFLDKTFTGRFLAVESEVGVIGRNVLNCVRLLLDGPALNWEEVPSTARGS